MNSCEMGDGIVLPISLNIEAVESLLPTMRQLDFKDSKSFPVDASKVDSITTSGIQLLLSLERTLEQKNIRLYLVNATENFTEAFKVLGLAAKLNTWSAGQ